MSKITVLQCDECGRWAEEAGVATYELRQDGRTVQIDLCTEDAEPLQTLLQAARELPARRRGRMQVKLDPTAEPLSAPLPSREAAPTPVPKKRTRSPQRGA